MTYPRVSSTNHLDLPARWHCVNKRWVLAIPTSVLVRRPIPGAKRISQHEGTCENHYIHVDTSAPELKGAQTNCMCYTHDCRGYSNKVFMYVFERCAQCCARYTTVFTWGSSTYLRSRKTSTPSSGAQPTSVAGVGTDSTVGVGMMPKP